MTYVDEGGAVPQRLPGYPPSPAVASKSARSRTQLVLMVTLAAVFLMLFVVPLGYGLYQGLTEGGREKRGKVTAQELAKHVAACGAPLPESSTPVPTFVPEGRPYQVTSTTFSQSAFACGGALELEHEQFHAYQWLKSRDGSGAVVGEADFDGDGKLDHVVEVRVTCEYGTCTPGQVFEH